MCPSVHFGVCGRIICTVNSGFTAPDLYKLAISAHEHNVSGPTGQSIQTIRSKRGRTCYFLNFAQLWLDRQHSDKVRGSISRNSARQHEPAANLDHLQPEAATQSKNRNKSVTVTDRMVSDKLIV